MKPKDDLPPEYIQSIFNYDAEKGILTHKKRHAVKEGAIASYVMNHGYAGVKIHQKLYLVHRIIWTFVTGQWPKLDIDHINCDKTDNRWSNLREATRTENCMNGRARRHHLKGAYVQKNGRWQSHIKIRGLHCHLGTFLTEKDANAAYKAASEQAFGSFARA